MGITKRDSPISWRPSSEARLALAELLASDPKLRRNEVINRAVIGLAGLSREPYWAAAPLSKTRAVVRRQTVQKPGWKKS